MPHQCTNCGKTFPDGSKEMLSGCPECGGNKFQFRPAGSLSDDAASAGPSAESDADASDAAARTEADAEAPPSGPADPDAATPDPDATTPDPDAADPDAGHAETPAADAGAPDADRPADDSDAEATDADADADAANGENTAQASARRDVVDPDELSSAVEREARDRPPQDVDGQVIEPQSDDDRPGIDELREELNEQFESIKILSPGQYELNLMELYDRDEYIISLQEDGRYVIEVPDTWREGPSDDT